MWWWRVWCGVVCGMGVAIRAFVFLQGWFNNTDQSKVSHLLGTTPIHTQTTNTRRPLSSSSSSSPSINQSIRPCHACPGGPH